MNWSNICRCLIDNGCSEHIAIGLTPNICEAALMMLVIYEVYVVVNRVAYKVVKVAIYV